MDWASFSSNVLLKWKVNIIYYSKYLEKAQVLKQYWICIYFWWKDSLLFSLLQKSNLHSKSTLILHFSGILKAAATMYKLNFVSGFKRVNHKFTIFSFLPFSIVVFHFVAQPLSCFAYDFSISARSWTSIHKSLHNLLPSSIRLVVRLKLPGSQKESEPAIKFSSLWCDIL